MEAMKCPSCGSPNIVRVNSIEYKCQNCNTSSKLSNDQTYLVLSIGAPCPSCGFNNESGVRFCGECGTKLVKKCFGCGTETLIDRKFCPNCGNDLNIPLNYNFCFTVIEFFDSPFGLGSIGKRHYGKIKDNDTVYVENTSAEKKFIVGFVSLLEDTEEMTGRIGLIIKNATRKDIHIGDKLIN